MHDLILNYFCLKKNQEKGGESKNVIDINPVNEFT